MEKITNKDFPKRTKKQNDSLHLFCEQIAEAFNSAGYEQKITFGTIDCPWTKESVKAIFKKISNAM